MSEIYAVNASGVGIFMWASWQFGLLLRASKLRLPRIAEIHIGYPRGRAVPSGESPNCHGEKKEGERRKKNHYPFPKNRSRFLLSASVSKMKYPHKIESIAFTQHTFIWVMTKTTKLQLMPLLKNTLSYSTTLHYPVTVEKPVDVLKLLEILSERSELQFKSAQCGEGFFYYIIDHLKVIGGMLSLFWDVRNFSLKVHNELLRIWFQCQGGSERSREKGRRKDFILERALGRQSSIIDGMGRYGRNSHFDCYI